MDQLSLEESSYPNRSPPIPQSPYMFLENLQISLYVVMGNTIPETLRITGHIHNIEVTILIDRRPASTILFKTVW